jgi:hypothetical protein
LRLKQTFSREFLLDEYVRQEKSISKISKETNKSRHRVKYGLIKYGIPIRHQFDGSVFTKEFLIQEYINNQKSSYTIAEEFGTSHDVVLDKLKKYNISIRSNSRLGRLNKHSSKTRNPVCTGDRFGKLTAVKKLNGRCEEWDCLCDCGKHIVVKATNLKKRVKSCGCLKAIKFEGYEGISGNLFCRYRLGAKTRDIIFDITPKDMWDKFVSQEGKCIISGVSIFLNKTVSSDRTASLDRIDSNVGYVLSNIQWVHKLVNTMKWNISCDQFIEWCKIIAQNNGTKI